MPHFTAADGANLFFRDDGAGLPVLCLSGLTRTHADFDYLAPHLPDVRLIRMDYRGRGASDWTGPQTYTIVQEGADALALLDHLGLARAAVIGTSRGGMIGMYLAATAHDRLMGLCLNDVGPVLEPAGLKRIGDYLGRHPAPRTIEALAAVYAANPEFPGVPQDRWLQEAALHSRPGGRGLQITYDPTLRDAFMPALKAPDFDLWPWFEDCAGLPLALIRGENSDLLSRATADEMARRRPDMIRAEVPDRGHIPFLDEGESLAAIRHWLKMVSC